MSPNAFIGKTRKPTEAELAAALGPAKVIWDQILADLAAECGADVQEWNSYSPKSRLVPACEAQGADYCVDCSVSGLFQGGFHLWRQGDAGGATMQMV